MEIEIKTNHVPRDLLDGYQLSPEERKELDYIDNIEEHFGRFFRYKGAIYDVNEFQRLIPAGATKNIIYEVHDLDGMFTGWQAIHPDSYFSGILIKFSNDDESVIVGRYYS